MKNALYTMFAAPVVCLVAQAEGGVETRDEQMCTPLMQAVASYPSVSLEKIREMIAAGADVNARDAHGNTPLMYARSIAYFSHEMESALPLVKLLVESGADVHALNGDGMNILELAACKKDIADSTVLQYLRSLGLEMSLNGQLAEACANNDVSRVKELLAAGADPNFARGFPLYICLGVGTHDMPHDAEIVELLLKAGANPNLRARSVMYCCTHGGPNLLPLLDAGLDIHLAGDDLPRFLLRLWQNETHFPPIQFSRFVRLGADVNAPSREPLLCYSASKRSGHDRRHIAYLLSIGADPNLKDSDGKTALDIAREEGRTDIIPLLENPQAPHPITTHAIDVPQGKNRCGGTPLTEAAQDGDAEKVQQLIAAGADIEALSGAWNGHTALSNALSYRRKNVVEVLVKAGAREHKVSIGELGCNMAIHELSGIEMKLRDMYTHRKTRGRNGRTPLMMAAYRNNPELVKRLLYASELNAADDAGNTALHLLRADSPAAAACARLLVESKADINARNHQGETPLHCAEGIGRASEECCYEGTLVRYLLSAGADAHARTAYGMNALELAMCLPESWPVGSLNPAADSPNSIVPILLEQGLDCSQDALLIGAAAANDVEAVKRLLAAGANPNAYGAGAPNALARCQSNLFVKKGHSKVITELLLAAGANPNLAAPELLVHGHLYIQPQILDMLLAAGLNLNSVSSAQLREFVSDARFHHPEIYELLVQHGAPAWNVGALAAELRAAVESGDAPAIYRVHNDYFPMDTPLPGEIPAPFADGQNTGGTALMLASALGKTDVVRILLCTCNVEATDAAGRTALEYAAANGYDDVVYLLLNAGAKRIPQAMQCAEQHGYTAVAGILKQFLQQ